MNPQEQHSKIICMRKISEIMLDMAKNETKRELLNSIMDDMVDAGHYDLNLKYLTQYDELKVDYSKLKEELKLATQPVAA